MDRSTEDLTAPHAEGATPLSEEELEGLLIPSIGTRAELNAAEQQNVFLGALWLEGRRNREQFDETFLWELHRQMFGQVWRWAGSARKTGKNIGVPIEQIRPGIRDLLEDVTIQRNSPEADRNGLCATFHQRLVRIHAFPNGNGRHARLMTDVLAEQLGIAAPSWGGNDLTSAGESRRRYIEALKQADNGELGPLVKFMWTNRDTAD